jgi:hypothetical protein
VENLILSLSKDGVFGSADFYLDRVADALSPPR